MNTRFLILGPVLFFSALSTQAGSPVNNPAVESLMTLYASEGADTTISGVAQGEQLWTEKFKNKTADRSCTSCHGADLAAAGKHINTGKAIKPMAPSVNSERLTDVKKIEKWFKRNCKWTLGRECSAQEKADLLSYLSKQ